MTLPRPLYPKLENSGGPGNNGEALLGVRVVVASSHGLAMLQERKEVRPWVSTVHEVVHKGGYERPSLVVGDPSYLQPNWVQQGSAILSSCGRAGVDSTAPLGESRAARSLLTPRVDASGRGESGDAFGEARVRCWPPRAGGVWVTGAVLPRCP